MREPILVNSIQGAALLGTGERTFHDLRRREDFRECCPEVRLSPRTVRWRVADLERFTQQLAEQRLPTMREPAQLAQGRRRAREASNVILAAAL